jgi:hypothetical protein
MAQQGAYPISMQNFRFICSTYVAESILSNQFALLLTSEVKDISICLLCHDRVEDDGGQYEQNRSWLRHRLESDEKKYKRVKSLSSSSLHTLPVHVDI